MAARQPRAGATARAEREGARYTPRVELPSESAERAAGLFPADPIAMRMNAAPRTAAYHLGVATLMVIVAWTPWGRRLLGVHPVFLTLTTAAFAIDLVDLARRVHDGSLFRPSAWPRRMLSAFVLLVYTASFAAPSEIVGSPAWIFLVMAGSIAGLIGTHLGPAFGVMALAAGPGLHVLTAPSVSAFSIFVSVGAALSAWSAALLGRRLSQLAIELERAAEIRVRLMNEAREDVRRLAAAMSIHDGLSGMFFGVRAQLEAARTLSDVIAPTRAFSRRARELVLPASGPSSIVATLRGLAELHRVALTIHGAPTFPDPVETSDIAFSATELVTNALRHREVSSITVTFLSGAVHGVSVRAEGPIASRGPRRGADESGGRGTRHLQLRAQAWGGVSSRVDSPATSSAEVSWPRPRAHLGPLWLALLVPLSPSRSSHCSPPRKRSESWWRI